MFGIMSKASALAAVAALRPNVDVMPPSMETPERSGLRLHDVLERIHVAADELDVVGRDNESIRNRCQDIVAKVESAATLGEDLAAVFGQVDALIRELEQTKSELIQRNAIFAIERDAHMELKSRHQILHDDNEEGQAQRETLRADVERLTHVATTSEARIDELEAKLREARSQLSAGDQERQDLTFRVSFLSDELRATQQRMLDADATLSRVQSELSSERHRLVLLEQTNMSLQTSLGDSQALAARLKTDLDDTNIGWSNAREQVIARDADIVKLQGEHAKMRGLWQQSTDAHATDVAALQSQIDSAKSRSDVADRLLAEARDELQVKLDELRQEERRTQDAVGAASVLEQKLAAAETVNGELNKRVSDIESSHERLIERVKPLVKAIRGKDTEIGKLQQQLDSAQARVATEAQRFAAELERAQDQIKTLTEAFEREKVLKALAEGALEVDRRERTQLQHALQSVRNSAVMERPQQNERLPAERPQG